MKGCIHQHIGDDGVIVCNHFSDFKNNIISYCDSNCSCRKPSNADKIREMTDEELADWLILNGDGSDYQTWLEWLRKEVTE